jgi:hypothetical protein
MHPNTKKRAYVPLWMLPFMVTYCKKDISLEEIAEVVKFLNFIPNSDLDTIKRMMGEISSLVRFAPRSSREELVITTKKLKKS